VLAVRTDVSRADEVEALAREAVDAFGGVHLLCNNAGVVTPTARLWELSLEDWEWIVGVNLWGVVHGIRAFVPILLEQKEAHVVNTASIAGLITGVLGPYSVSKHAVVALSEALSLELTTMGAAIGVSVLCPGWVRTRITEADRNRPAGPAPEPTDPMLRAMHEMFGGLVATGMAPALVAEHVFQAVKEGRFYVLTHPEMATAVEQRVQDILQGRPPSMPILA
jgi:NAD(P)-dependent dehydrogenase (short-subunit alcohol dehydrogenase family)